MRVVRSVGVVLGISVLIAILSCSGSDSIDKMVIGEKYELVSVEYKRPSRSYTEIRVAFANDTIERMVPLPVFDVVIKNGDSETAITDLVPFIIEPAESSCIKKVIEDGRRHITMYLHPKEIIRLQLEVYLGFSVERTKLPKI